jgi:hypothetical protein
MPTDAELLLEIKATLRPWLEQLEQDKNIPKNTRRDWKARVLYIMQRVDQQQEN